MTGVKKWLRQMAGVSKTSIKRQVLVLVLASGLVTFLATLALFGYTLVALQKTLSHEERLVEESAAQSVGDFAASWGKDWLRTLAEQEADYMGRELMVNGEDVECLADSITRLMRAKEYYGERRLINSRESSDIMTGTPYIHYSPGVTGEDQELAEEIGKVGNFVDVLLPMSRSYVGYHTSLFVASRKGYMLCVDIHRGGLEESIYATPQQRDDFVANYDPRQRPWYKMAQEKGGLVYTYVYRGEDGLLVMTCAMPYYDENGFAGVVGIGGSIEDLQRQVTNASIGDTGISFALDGKGNVVMSSSSKGVLAAKSEGADLRENPEPTLAEAARRMTAGENDVTKVMVEGEEYYLAFAPLENLGWSFGTLISRGEVTDPVNQARERVHEKMEASLALMSEAFVSAALTGLLLLLPLVLVAFYASGALAGRLTQPIRNLADGVREIASGNLDKTLEIHTGNEIEHLAECFNGMTAELKEHIQRLSEVAAKEERTRTELEVATRIQAGMLPAALKTTPHREKYDLCASMHPAREVGGDFYDFYFVDDDTLAITVADVSDKGVPAALFMVIAKTLLKDQALLQGREKLARAVAEANDALVQSNQAFMFVTVFTGLLHLPTGKFTYVNAGHNPPLLRRRKGYEYLSKAPNPVLGVQDGMEFKAEELTLAPGDALLLYTDGVTEAMNEEGKFFGEALLKEKLDEAGAAGAADMLVAVHGAVHSFAGEASQSDDITMLALVYKENKQL